MLRKRYLFFAEAAKPGDIVFAAFGGQYRFTAIPVDGISLEDKKWLSSAALADAIFMR